MTQEGLDPPGPPGSDDAGHAEQSEADRRARLAALLSVDIGASNTSGDGPPEGSSVQATPDTDVLGAETPDIDEPDGANEQVRTNGRAGSSGVGTWSWLVLVALLVGGAGLVYAGTRIVRSSTEGQVLAPIDDPQAPGFEALVDPTPTMVLLHDVGGGLDTITVLSLPDPAIGGGGVIFVPDRTVADVPLYETSPIEIAYDLGDAQFEADAVGLLLGSSMLDHAVVDASRWADLVAPVAPISLANPNELLVDGAVRFPAGEITLSAADVGPYLEARVEGESDLARLFRHELFWRAWLAAVAADGTAEAVPGELDTGIARFVRALASGDAVVETLPVQPATPGRFGDAPAFVPRFDQMAALVDRLIPFPVSPGPGERARLRVLNGTTDTGHAAAVARLLPPAGVEITTIGNAATFDVATTTVSYFDAEFRDEAERIVELLGVGRLVEEDQASDSVDITVTLGADHAADGT